MNRLKTVQDFLEFIKNSWSTTFGLISAILLAVILEFIILSDLIDDKLYLGAIYIITVLIILAIWFIQRRLPKTRRGKIGFLVCIYCKPEQERERVKEDFIITLRRLIKGGSLGNSFDFINLSQHKALNVKDEDDARELRRKCKAHFVLWGRVRKRPLDGEWHYLTELAGLVHHIPVIKPISLQFAKEFTELLPNRIKFPEKNEWGVFEFTSNWVDLVARYIIGTAAMLSYDFEYATQLYSDLEKRLKQYDPKIPIISKIEKKLPKRYSEISLSKATIAHLKWQKNKQQIHVEEMGNYLDEIDENSYKNQRLYLLRGIFFFLNCRDIDSAIKELKKCKRGKDKTWMINLAFLFGYRKDLKAAYQHYCRAAKSLIDPSLIGQIEEFICWVIDTEPQNCHLYYCLAIFNWKIKGDYRAAIADFESFLKCNSVDDFENEKKLVLKWCQELENKT